MTITTDLRVAGGKKTGPQTRLTYTGVKDAEELQKKVFEYWIKFRTNDGAAAALFADGIGINNRKLNPGEFAMLHAQYVVANQQTAYEYFTTIGYVNKPEEMDYLVMFKYLTRTDRILTRTVEPGELAELCYRAQNTKLYSNPNRSYFENYSEQLAKLANRVYPNLTLEQSKDVINGLRWTGK